MDILLLDGVPVVLEGANQVTPRMDSVDMVVYSTAQYVPERLNTSCVRGHGRPYHHPDSVLLQELLPMSIWPACSLGSALAQHMVSDSASDRPPVAS